MFMKYLLGISLACAIAYPVFSEANPLNQTVQNGKQLFMTATFGGNGMSCNSCHKAGGTTSGQLPNGKSIPSLGNAAAIFPRFNKRLGVVLTLQDQVHNCVAGALEGTPPSHDSKEMVALISYLTSLSQGKPVNMGGKPE
jgi:thiosulfate dehydrogenase